MAKSVTINVSVKDTELFNAVLHALYVGCSALDEIGSERAIAALEEIKTLLESVDIEMETKEG